LWTDKYALGADELLNFRRSSSHLMTELNFILQYGKLRLDFGMNNWKNVDKRPSFNQNAATPPYPYEEKNFYVNSSNDLWMATMWPHYQMLNEIYYSNLLEQIKDFKKKNDGFDFDKGIVYGNLGVAQSAQMKLDEGFANILKALVDDAPYSATATPEQNFWKSPLFEQFEKSYVKIPLQTLISGLGTNGATPVETFVETLLTTLSDHQRIFFEYSFIEINYNQKIWQEKENTLTANRLLAYAQDLCLFNEALLKSKFSATDLTRLGRRHELGSLIPSKFTVDCSGCHADDITELDDKLRIEMGTADLRIRCLRILLTLRNYSSHNIEGGTGANYFYAEYTRIFSELIRATCFIALLPNPP
jgi:hypothetical protein